MRLAGGGKNEEWESREGGERTPEWDVCVAIDHSRCRLVPASGYKELDGEGRGPGSPLLCCLSQ